MRKARKEGYELAKVLSTVDLSKFECSYRCYDCIYWGSGFCEAKQIKSAIEKSRKYVSEHDE